MALAPNAIAATEDFEFAALSHARNYRHTLMREFGPALRGEVLEIGAGIGQMSEELVRQPGVKRTLAVEPDPGFCAQHRKRLPGHELLEGIAADLPIGSAWDAILSVNVLEHIEADAEELAIYSRLLAPRAGRLCLFVPARPEIYAPIDGDFGHFRRYTRPELRDKLAAAGFEIERLVYFNWAGYFAWWLSFCLLKRRSFDMGSVLFYDRVIFPVVHWTEAHVMRPPFGQSLLAVARARP